jgi:hypothetical protein
MQPQGLARQERLVIALNLDGSAGELLANVSVEELVPRPFAQESEFAEFIRDHPWLIGPGLVPVVCDPQGLGGPDLVLIEQQGRRHIVELKLGLLGPEAIGQALSYGGTYAWRFPISDYAKLNQVVSRCESFLSEAPDDQGFPNLYLVAGGSTKTPAQISPTVRGALFIMTHLFMIPIVAIEVNRADCRGRAVVIRTQPLPSETDVWLIRSWNPRLK